MIVTVIAQPSERPRLVMEEDRDRVEREARRERGRCCDRGQLREGEKSQLAIQGYDSPRSARSLVSMTGDRAQEKAIRLPTLERRG